jgi:DNA repair protein RadC
LFGNCLPLEVRQPADVVGFFDIWNFKNVDYPRQTNPSPHYKLIHNMKISDIPKINRPREKLLAKGAQSLSNKQLLAILLNTGTKGKSALDLATKILNQFPINSIAKIKPSNLKKLKGISSAKIATILAAFELSKRALAKFNNGLIIIDSPEKAVEQLNDIRKRTKEHFVALYLNARNQLLHKETITIGLVAKSLVHPREVFEPAIRYLASGVIIAHNHPSGNPEPSEDDIQITNKIAQSGEILGICVIDHIVVTPTAFTSFANKGMLLQNRI